MKNNIKIKKLLTICLSLTLTSSLITFTHAKPKNTQKLIMKNSKNNFK